MPKENTHLLFAYELLEGFQGQDLLRDISTALEYYLFGSISPDIFFYSGTKDLLRISETMHGKTGEPTNLPILAMLEEAGGPEDIALILGYITHCALDITFHPVIYYLSGNYYDDDPAKKAHAVYLHRHLETCLDLELHHTFRLHRWISTSLPNGRVYEKVICRKFAISPGTIRKVLRKQIVANWLFTSIAAYRFFAFLGWAGILKEKALLGLFYEDALQGPCLTEELSVKDLITGEDRTTTITDLFALARQTACPMMTAAYNFWKGKINRDELIQAIPGLSLDTGKLMVTPSSIKFTA